MNLKKRRSISRFKLGATVILSSLEIFVFVNRAENVQIRYYYENWQDPVALAVNLYFSPDLKFLEGFQPLKLYATD